MGGEQAIGGSVNRKLLLDILVREKYNGHILSGADAIHSPSIYGIDEIYRKYDSQSASGMETGFPEMGLGRWKQDVKLRYAG